MVVTKKGKCARLKKKAMNLFSGVEKLTTERERDYLVFGVSKMKRWD
jgi:hypothetical protein